MFTGIIVGIIVGALVGLAIGYRVGFDDGNAIGFEIGYEEAIFEHYGGMQWEVTSQGEALCDEAREERAELTLHPMFSSPDKKETNA